MIDVNAFIGSYPFRHLPHPDADVLALVLAREGLDGAWVGYLPSAFHRDPAPGNAVLFESLAAQPSLRPAPTVRPDWPDWERTLRDCVDRSVAAVRAYPPQWGFAPDAAPMRALAEACGDAGLPLVLTVRFEDMRQRHGIDVAGDLGAAAVRALARRNGRTRIVVTAAGRDLIQEIHWGLTDEEQRFVWYDISWIWGPPEDHLAELLRTIGPDRFLFGSAWPLRLSQTPRANLDLLPDDLVGVELADAGRWTSVRP